MRLFNKEVFNEYIDGTGIRYSSSDFNPMLGAAEKLVLHCKTSKVAGTSPTLTVAIEHSNDGKDWVTASTVINGVALTTNSVNINLGDSGSTLFAAFARLKVTLGGASPSASVAITACGRAEQAGA